MFTICSCLKQHDENSTKTEATLWHGRCQFKSHSLTDWQQRHFMVGRHSFWVLCLKLDLSPGPYPMKCLNIFLDISRYLWVLTLDILSLWWFLWLLITGIGQKRHCGSFRSKVVGTMKWQGRWFDFHLISNGIARHIAILCFPLVTLLCTIFKTWKHPFFTS